MRKRAALLWETDDDEVEFTDGVFIRTNKTSRKRRARKRRARKSAGKSWRKIRADSRVEITAEECPKCGTKELRRSPDGRLFRMCFDVRFTAGGIRRWTTRVATLRHHCATCDSTFIPRDYVRLSSHGHSLKSWAMYKHVGHQISLASIADEIRECFGINTNASDVHDFKMAHACYYEQTYRNLQEKLVTGTLLHADETEVHLKPNGKGYVWAFTNLEEVVFIYKPSREGGFLKDMLSDFHGVLVSDFYSAYDSLG
ncbi:MAG: transposase, partial [Planctomycetes bacterium]|nr:transposase [Planctomycetota bacterium]